MQSITDKKPKKAALTLLIISVMFLNSCFAINHFKLTNRYRNDTERYENLKDENVNPSNMQAFEYAGRYLDTARKANRRWNNSRARLFLDMAEEHMDAIENAPAIPQGLMDIYERTEPFTPEPESAPQ